MCWGCGIPPPKKNLHIICHCYRVGGSHTNAGICIHSLHNGFTWDRVGFWSNQKAVFQVTSVVTPSAAGISWPHLVDGDRLSPLKSWSKNPLANGQIFRNGVGPVLVLQTDWPDFCPFSNRDEFVWVSKMWGHVCREEKKRNLFVEHLEDHPS